MKKRGYDRRSAQFQPGLCSGLSAPAFCGTPSTHHTPPLCSRQEIIELSAVIVDTHSMTVLEGGFQQVRWDWQVSCRHLPHHSGQAGSGTRAQCQPIFPSSPPLPSQFVRPTENPRLTEFCTKLTGIQQEQVGCGGGSRS